MLLLKFFDLVQALKVDTCRIVVVSVQNQADEVLNTVACQTCSFDDAVVIDAAMVTPDYEGCAFGDFTEQSFDDRLMLGLFGVIAFEVVAKTLKKLQKNLPVRRSGAKRVQFALISLHHRSTLPVKVVFNVQAVGLIIDEQRNGGKKYKQKNPHLRFVQA